MRPALLGRDSKALINAIDTAALMKKGQTDATIRFTCGVDEAGRCYGMAVYGGTPNSDALKKEVLLRSEAEWPIFIPAIYHSRACRASVCGTVVFFIKDDKPHLRIYLNEESDHISQGDDFIAPQAIYVQGQRFRGYDWPNGGVGSNGVVIARVTVDESGKFMGAEIAMEKPEGRGFGAEVMKKIGGVVFLPGYLHGQPVSSTANLPIMFNSGRGARWTPG